MTTLAEPAAAIRQAAGKVPITVVVLARNEQANLPRCLGSVGFASEIVVVDDFSEDRTAAVARRCGARVCRHRFRSFADQRNWAADSAGLRNEWILHLDADEEVTPGLAGEIAERISAAEPEVAGYYLCFKTIFMGRWLRYSSTYPVFVLRLVRRGRVRYAESGHGEAYEVDGSLGRLREPFLHHNFSKGIGEWISRHNRYSDLEARALAAGAPSLDLGGLLAADPRRRRRALKGVSQKLPARPWFKFAYMYLLRRGFLDGRAGLSYCALQAVYEHMICLKVREIRQRGMGLER